MRQLCGGRTGDREAGYSPIEAVITFPLIVFLLFLVVQFALLWHGRHVAEAAAQTGLRSARVYQATADAGRSDATSYLQQVAPRLLTDQQVTVTRDATQVRVQVHASVLRILPFPLTVTAAAAGPVERYVPR